MEAQSTQVRSASKSSEATLSVLLTGPIVSTTISQQRNVLHGLESEGLWVKCSPFLVR